jgi:hypothetical protein
MDICRDNHVMEECCVAYTSIREAVLRDIKPDQRTLLAVIRPPFESGMSNACTCQSQMP